PAQFGLVRNRSVLRVDGAVPRTFLPRLPVTVEATREEFETGATQLRLAQRISLFYRGLALSNQLGWIEIRDAAGARQSQATGNVLLSRYTSSFSARGEVQYDLRPRREVSSVALTAERRFPRGFLLSAGVNRILRAHQTRYLAGVSKNAGAFGFGLKADYAQP